ncbi:MAG: hypothetical protein JW936_10090 [Sedimentisphaerales bacterium]|nr:hypothetical protein [Sedimentisphaerales bacterium]
MSTVVPEKPKRGIESISHLFLSQQKTDGALQSTPARPVRTAPGKPAATVVTSQEQECLSEQSPQQSAKDSQTAIVFAGTQTNETLDTYQTIKWLAHTVANLDGIALFFPRTSDTSLAQQIADKLINTCRRFLNIELNYLGCATQTQLENPSTLPHFLLSQAQDQNYVLLTTACAVDSDQNNAADSCTAACDTIASTTPSVKQPIFVDTPPETNSQLAQTLASAPEHCLPELELPQTLDLPLPTRIPDSIRLIADAAGQCYVLSAALADPDSALADALNARQWLCDHLKLIAQACPQNSIDTEIEPGIALVIPESPLSPQNPLDQLHLPVITKHWHALQIDDSYALLIV